MPNRLSLRDHADRAALTDELHARPFAQLATPVVASYVAFLTGEGSAAADRAHAEALAVALGAPWPADTRDFAIFGTDGVRVRWERHTEFTSYTVFAEGPVGPAAPFARDPLTLLPPAWLAACPGEVIVATRVAVLAPDEPLDAEAVVALLASDQNAAALVSGGDAAVYTDFRIHADGAGRILIEDRGLRPRQAGRLVQRLTEIETYRTLAMLGFQVSRALGPDLGRLEQSLAAVAGAITSSMGAADDRAALDRLSAIAAEVERIAADHSYRFAATRAYRTLVERRVEDLRQQRLAGWQTIGEFLDRRFGPAMRTVDAVAARHLALADRVQRASTLLRTRVDVALQEQNQALLRSMDDRADAQLRLQQTVEGLSVVAIGYYLVGLLAYLAKAAKAAGVPIDPDLAAGVALPLVLGAVWIGIRRLRHALKKA